MHKLFIQAFAFNASAAFIYKIALLLHQIFLYCAIPEYLYGQQSSIFAALYTCIALTNFGFDETLLPFFSNYCQSKQQSQQLLFHGFTQMAIIGIVAGACWILIMQCSGAFLHNLQNYCNKNLIFIILALFFIESIKKSTIALMQLAFMHKQIAYAHISMLMLYIGSVWGLYYYHGQLKLENIFLPILITSVIELCYLNYHVIQWYAKLPVQEQDTPTIPFKLFFGQRVFNYINQLTKIVYSPNSMTLFFAYALGFAQAAKIKFFTNIITLSYTCITKSVGVTSGAIFSSTQSDNIKDIFKNITYRYFQLLTILSFVMVIVISYAYKHAMITKIMAWQILLFFTISFLELIALTYEQLLIARGKAWYLAWINVFGLLLLLICAYGYRYNLVSLQILVSVCIVIKVISFFVLVLESSFYS